MAKDLSEVVFPSNPADRKIISNAIGELVASMTRMASERDLQKETVDKIKEEYEIPPALLKTLAKYAFDPESKAVVDVKNELTDEGYELFVATTRGLDPDSGGITQDQIVQRDEALKKKAEFNRNDEVPENVFDEL